MSKTFTDLKDGALYKLERDVLNPGGDGRVKHDPLKEKVWSEGTRFRARKTYLDDSILKDKGVEFDPESLAYFELEFVDARYTTYLVVHRQDYEKDPKRRDGVRYARVVAIMDALVDCAENWSSFAKRLGLDKGWGEDTLRKLHESGAVTLEQIEAARTSAYNEPEPE